MQQFMTTGRQSTPLKLQPYTHIAQLLKTGPNKVLLKVSNITECGGRESQEQSRME